jgi:cytoskeleton protein RodZ
MATSRKETTTGNGEQSLGGYLTELREKRTLSREDVVAQTRIPMHYIKMMENDDFSLIADQLYLMPFLRRYATFLALDPDEMVIRFIHEVQRSESSVVRMSEPIVSARDRRGNRWRTVAIWLAGALVVVSVVALFSHERHRASGNIETTVPAMPHQAAGNAQPGVE